MIGRPAVCLLALVLSPALFAQSPGASWKYSESKYGLRELAVETKAPVLGKETVVKLRFQCSPKDEKDVHGAISLDLTISDLKRFPQFHFDDFEGPDPAIGSRKLMEIAIKGPKGVTKIMVNPGGWYSAEPEGGFTFGLSALSRQKVSDPRKIIQQLQAGATEIEIVIRDSKTPEVKIKVAIPASDIQEHLKSLVQGLP